MRIPHQFPILAYVMAVMTATMTLIYTPQKCLAADPDLVNILQLPVAKVAHSNVPASETGQLKVLNDGDISTSGQFTASEANPLTVVYGFDDQTVTLEQLTVQIGSNDHESQARHFDLLISNLSPHAGFQAVREDGLKASSEPQEFRCMPIAAKWIMLRFTPGKQAKRLAIAELSLRGHLGAPQTRYSFNESPAKAFDVLKRLQKNATLNVSVSKDEADLFDDAKDGKLNRWTFAEAALLSSGVSDAKQRKRYLAAINQLEIEARQVTRSAKTPFERGATLLKFLHQGPMSKGYSSHQTSVAKILDEGTFNCVSSATLFNILGRRMGLDARGIEVPHHAFSVVYDGTRHVDVETTTDGGFNPARDPEALKEFTELTGFNYIPDSNRAERREVKEIGLVAITYYNRGVGYTDEKQYHAALLAYFCAMSLDSEFDSSIKNALSVLVNWSAELAEQKQHSEALEVLKTGLELAPQDAALLNNHRYVWSNWAQTLIKSGETDEALSVLQRAAQAIPDGDFVRMQAWVYIQRGEEFIKSGNWDAALALVEPGRRKLTERVALDALNEWGTGLRHRWAQDAERNGQYEKAANLLDIALKEQPEDQSLPNHIAYVVQEWLRQVKEKQGAAAAEKVLITALKRYSNIKDVRDVAKNHLYHVVTDFVQEQKYDQAMKVADRAGELLDDNAAASEIMHSVYDQWSQELTRQEKWQDATSLYAKALKRFPEDGHLRNNCLATWGRWAESYIGKKDWSGALAVYEKALMQLDDKDFATTNIIYCVQEWATAEYESNGLNASKDVFEKELKRFPSIPKLQEVLGSHVHRSAKKLCEAGKYDAALDAVEAFRGLLDSEQAVGDLAAAVYDLQAAEHRKNGLWKQAVDTYTRGLKKYPKNDHLIQNSIATWDSWAKSYMDQKAWKEAIDVYSKALEQHPGNAIFTNNRDYCKQEMSK